MYNQKPENPQEGDYYRQLVDPPPQGMYWYGVSWHNQTYGYQFRYLNGEWVGINSFENWDERFRDQQIGILIDKS